MSNDKIKFQRTKDGIQIFINGRNLIDLLREYEKPFTVIFAKKDLLILIKSQTKVENKAWEDYIKSLGNPGASGIPKY